VELKLKRYESKVLEILDDGSAVIELPEELCIELGWNVGDELTFKIKNDIIIIKKSDGCKSTD
jgi:antitoxin component of MazEF toxin-antitoxin module